MILWIEWLNPTEPSFDSHRDCSTGLHIPSAFTPNRDGVNDLFRAKIYGNIVVFKLEVYNRYGELVFKTTDPSAGWDGKFKGDLQPMSAFTWNCKYQFAGKNLISFKGSVILIR